MMNQAGSLLTVHCPFGTPPLKRDTPRHLRSLAICMYSAGAAELVSVSGNGGSIQKDSLILGRGWRCCSLCAADQLPAVINGMESSSLGPPSRLHEKDPAVVLPPLSVCRSPLHSLSPRRVMWSVQAWQSGRGVQVEGHSCNKRESERCTHTPLLKCAEQEPT
jgi:hypothetical protein